MMETDPASLDKFGSVERGNGFARLPARILNFGEHVWLL